MFNNGYPYTDFHELNLDWIVKHFKEFVEKLASLETWRAQHETEYEELYSMLRDIENGNFTDAMYAQIKRWVVSNLYSIVGELIKFISFELTDSGYFVVNIPQNWREITFNTTELDIFTPLQPEFGHLTLSY